MKHKLILFSFSACLFMVGPVLTAETDPPETLVDKGACPFECCTYRTWYVEKATELREKPEINSKVLSSVKPGDRVEAITGEVHVTAGKFLVKRQFSRFKPGDLILVYTYLGEGRFKVWFNGQYYEEDLDFSPYSPIGKESRLGEFQNEPVSIWWVKIKTQDGQIGWSNLPDHFSNKDACS